MRKCDDYLCCSGYRYAPEQFKAYRVMGFSNGNRNIPLYEQIALDYDETRECGNALCTMNKKAAIAKLKSILRKKEQKQKRYVTYGYRLMEEERRYAFVSQLHVANDADIELRLRTFKRVKDHMQHSNWECERYTETTLGAGYTIESTRVLVDKINPNKPLKIYFKN